MSRHHRGTMRCAHSMFVVICVLLMAVEVASTNKTKEKEKLIMAFLLPWTGTSWPIGSSIGPAILPSLEAVKELELIPSYNIKWYLGDTYCNPLGGMQKAVEIWKLNRNLDVIIGDGCSVSCVPVSLIASAWNTPMVSWACTESALSDKFTHPTFSRVTSSSETFIPAYFWLMKTFEWSRVGLLADTSKVSQEFMKGILVYFRAHGIKTYYNVISITGKITNKQILSRLTNTIRYLKKEVRIIFISLHHEDLLHVLSTAQDEGMLNGEYVFVATEGFLHQNTRLGITQGMLLVTTQFSRTFEWSQFASRTIQGFSDPAFQGMPRLPLNASISQVPKYAGLIHDAVLLWAYGVNKTLEQGYSPHDGFKVAENIFNMSFEGMSGTVTIDEKGDRKSNLMISIIQNQKLVPLMKWIAAESRLTKIYKAEDPTDWSGIIWPGNASSIPLDSPLCGWKNEHCRDKDGNNTIVIVSSVALVMIIVAATIMVVLFRKMRFEKALQDAKMYCIPREEIQLTKHLLSRISLQSASSANTSNKGDFAEVGKVRNVNIAIKKLGTGSISITDRSVLMEIKAMKEIHHENINMFVGICLEQPHALVLMTYAPRGSLYDVLHDDNVKLTWDFKLSLVNDVAQGMKYLHSTPIGFHGHLTSSNCLVNSQWSCKVTDYGLTYIKKQAKISDSSTKMSPWQMLWTAPELLSSNLASLQGTQKGDVYSFAIICQEVVLQDFPYADNSPLLAPEEITKRVNGKEHPPYRPYLSEDRCSSAWRDMIVKCWNEDEDQRPTFSGLHAMINRIGGGTVPSLVDSIITRLEIHTRHLEEIVLERSRGLEEEKMKMEVLLQDLLPRSVAEKLKNGLPILPESFESVTILFSDIVSFTRISAAGTPIDVVKMLNFMYTVFDDIASMFDVYKVATIGDAYFVASGVPNKNGDRHAVEICNMALKLINGIQECPIPHLPEETLKMRIGIHSGPCVAGVAGIKMPRYLLFGETVDAASSMEATGVSMHIHISGATKRLLDKTGRFKIEERGNMIIKGLGETCTYWLIG